MSRVTLDAELMARFQSLDQQAELCDADGRTRGRYLPEQVYQKLMYQLAESQRPHLSPEEIERRRNESGGKFLADILQRLRTP